jgi:hypothetical protein
MTQVESVREEVAVTLAASRLKPSYKAARS